MNYVKHSPLKLLGLAVAMIFALAACSTSPAPNQVVEDQEISYLAKVDTDSHMSQSQLEQMYGAKAIVYKPNAGFAILGFTQAQSELTTLSVEPNATVVTPIHANGSSAWASGSSAWASGSSAWASGSSAWASGSSAWASGTASLPGESLAVLDLVGISAAHAAASNFGGGIKVAVIDTGLDLDHAAFSGRLAPASEWKDYIDNDSNPEDDPMGASNNGPLFGHGTAVAGIISQVAPEATILPIRVLSSAGTGDVDDVISAIDWAILKGAHVINLSLGTNVNLVTLKAMIDYASSQGVYVAAASGNAGASSIDYPAAYANSATVEGFIMSVGSTNASNAASNFSNADSNLEFLAPGENVFSSYPNNMVGTFSGTSFSTPIVSGMIALGMGELANLNAINLAVFETYLSTASLSVSGTNTGYGIPQADDLLGALP